jgi:hypothetical protein
MEIVNLDTLLNKLREIEEKLEAQAELIAELTEKLNEVV